MLATRAVAVLAVAVAVTGCASEPPAAAPASAPAPAGVAATELGALPDCSEPPAAARDDVEGLMLPTRSVVTGVTRQNPLVTVTAFVPLTPAQFERAYPDMDGITILLTENEIYEAELLVSNGEYRNFLKATATCSTGSQVMAVVAPEVDAEGLPLPSGATATPSPPA